MLAPEVVQRRVSAAFGMGENRAQIGAEFMLELAKQFVNDAVPGEFEHQIAAITRRGLEHVQAGEMNRREVVECCRERAELPDCRAPRSMSEAPQCPWPGRRQ